MRAKLYKLKYVVNSLYCHMQTLRTRKNLLLDFGPAFSYQLDGRLVTDEKTTARIQSIQNLQATYRGWVGVVEAEIFLMGFDAGVEWHRSMGISQQK